MKKDISINQLVIPVYLNEKTVLDMLAIIEDGFSMVSEVSSANQDSSSTSGSVSGGFSTKAILDKLLKIQLETNVQVGKEESKSSEFKQEKVHTNVSLFSKFRHSLIENNLLFSKVGDNLDFGKVKSGDFIEFEGSLQKNPLIDVMEKIVAAMRMVEIFEDKPQTGGKKAAALAKTENNNFIKQITSFLGELKHTGTVDFVIENTSGTLVLSAQEKYLSNDNISEILGGTFKILGKVIHVCNDDNGINLLRKTTLNILDNDSLSGFINTFDDPAFSQLNLPQVKYKIEAPSAIVIPIAIYA